MTREDLRRKIELPAVVHVVHAEAEADEIRGDLALITAVAPLASLVVALGAALGPTLNTRRKAYESFEQPN